MADVTPGTPVRPAVKKPPLLWRQTQKIVERIENRLGQPFVAYWNSTNGSICQNDTIGFYGLLNQVGHKEAIYLLIKSDGGSGQASLRMVHLVREFAKHVVALVPLECASAATMFALGADQIQMGPLAYLSAVDTSIKHDLSPLDNSNYRVSVSQDELTRVVNLWRNEHRGNDGNPYQSLYQYVHPLVVGAVDRASSLSLKLCNEILSYHIADQDKVQEISRRLNSDYPAHSYPITIREAVRLGLNVCEMPTDINDLLIELNELYSEMGQDAITDYDEENYHNNEILSIIEARNVQMFYQVDKDWHYRKEERRWVPMNDNSSWHKVQNVAGRVKRSVFHIR